MTPLESLQTYGYAIIPGVFSKKQCAVLGDRLHSLETRLRNLGKTQHMTDSQVVIYCPEVLDPAFVLLIEQPAILSIVSEVLPAPYILSCYAASRSGPRPSNRPHIDGRAPIRDFKDTTHISAVICLDDYTEANGALTVWPMSHTTGSKPPEGVPADKVPGRISCEAKRGSLIFFLGSTWHEIGVNRNGKRRWGLILTYCRWWVKPTYDYTQYDYRRVTAKQRELYGFTSRPPAPLDSRHLTLT